MKGQHHAKTKQAMREEFVEQDDYLEALARLGEASYEDRARWILDFACQNLATLPKESIRNFRRDGQVFVGSLVWKRTPDSKFRRAFPRHLPSDRELRQSQRWLLNLFQSLAPGGVNIFTTKSWGGILAVSSQGKLDGGPCPEVVPWREAFKLQVYNTLLAVKTIFRFCQNDKCRKPFLARKRQVYCSSACSQSHRTRVWRSKNLERFRAARRAYYKRQRKAHLGQPVKIQPYRKKGVRL